jgi:AcrR family transcriptional regulator
MTLPSPDSHDAGPITQTDRTDGRRERSKSSRAKIIAAMLELVERGDVQPSAARVADHAGVGLRTVFRHFDDMDSLYREMAEAIEQRVLPIISRPFASQNWQDRIRELAVRRPEVFEAILPFRISANLKRYQSAFLMADYIRLHKMERALVDVHLSDAAKADAAGVEALHVALSFQCWRLLRHDQQLTPEAAQRVVSRMVDDLLARLPGDAG